MQNGVIGKKSLTEIMDDFRNFVSNKIRPNVSTFEENEGIPPIVISLLGENRYLGACIPKEYGGLGLSPLQYGEFTEILGKACSSTRALLTVHTSLVGETILRVGNDTQKNKWLPLISTGNKIGAFALTEPEIGSDAKNIKTTYNKVDKGYIINGQKKWITFGHLADFFLVIAAENGTVSAFIVERGFKGVVTKPIKGLLAGRAAYIAEINFENVLVPEENVLGKIGGGFSYVVSSALDSGRYSIAWAGLAIAQEALDAMVTYSRNRVQFEQKLYNFQSIQAFIANATVKIHAGRCLCMDAGRMREEMHPDAIMQTNIAKFYTSKIAMEIATDAVQVHGGNGCYNKFPVERLFREAKILEIIEGSTQIQQEIISRFALRRYYSREYEKNYME